MTICFIRHAALVYMVRVLCDYFFTAEQTPSPSTSLYRRKEWECACVWQWEDGILYIWKSHQLSPLVSLSAALFPLYHQTSLSLLSFLLPFPATSTISPLLMHASAAHPNWEGYPQNGMTATERRLTADAFSITVVCKLNFLYA